LVVKLSFVGAVSLALPIHGAINWNWWLSYGNITARYAQVACMREGVDRRAEYQTTVERYLQSSSIDRSSTAANQELWIACGQLVDALHAAMVDEYRAGNEHFIRAEDQRLAAQLQDVLRDVHFATAHAKETRNIQALERELAEVHEFIPHNIARIAHTPKIVLLCSVMVAAGYWLYRKYGDKITQLAQQAEQKVEQEVSDAGHTLAHEIVNFAKEDPDEKSAV
jgi:hypothetical protein